MMNHLNIMMTMY